MLVIDGKYSGDGRIRRIKIPWGFRRESLGGTALKKTCIAKAKLEIQKFAEKKEDGDHWIPPKFLERPTTVRPAKVAREICSSANRESEVHESMNNVNENPEIARRDFAI